MRHGGTLTRNSRASLWRFTRALFTTNLNAALALRGAFVMQTVFMMLNNIVFFVFWWVLLRRVPHLRGWQLSDVEVLFGITATSFGLVVAVTGGVRQLVARPFATVEGPGQVKAIVGRFRLLQRGA